MGWMPTSIERSGKEIRFYLTRLYGLDADSELGSEQESGKLCILRGFLKNEEFGLGRGQALRLPQQIVHVSLTTARSEQSFDVAVGGFNHSHRYLRPAVVQDALEMIQ